MFRPHRPFQLMSLICILALTACGDQADVDQPASEVGTVPQMTAAVEEPTAVPTFQPTMEKQAEEGQSPDQSHVSSMDWIVAQSIEELVLGSPVIVAGRVIGSSGVINMARESDDFKQPDSFIFMLGQTYQVEVDQYLKGDGGSTLQIVKREGFTYSRDDQEVDQSPSPNEIESLKQSSLENGEHVPLRIGETYVFFLGDLASGFDPMEYVTGVVGEPWRFVLTADGTLIPESASEEAIDHFGEIGLSEVVEIIQQHGADAP